jgi:hypothetical protein
MAELVEVNIDSINKEDVERWADEEGSIKLSDTQWERVADEIEGRINLYIDGLLQDIVEDIREGFYDEDN